MLALYARYNCTSNAEAYREICEALGRYTPRPRVNDCIGVKPEQNVRATPQEIHQTYSLLLSMLPLTPTHKAHLLSPRRGLTEEQIARFGFKSTPPAFLCRSYAERLRRQGCTLQGVPGFYQDDAGRWTINFGSRTAGILLPAVGMDGLICGMQIRLDTPLHRRDDPPGKSGAKYIWLSSVGKPHGVTSGSPLHFVGEPFAKTVYVTEGLLKADIAHCLTGRSFVAVAGVNSLNGLEQKNHRSIRCAECGNMYVCKGCGKTVHGYGRYIDEHFYCNECSYECAVCKEKFIGMPRIGIARSGEQRGICPACYAQVVDVCGNCTIHSDCLSIGANRFCPNQMSGLAA